jgi:hypothetical protein
MNQLLIRLSFHELDPQKAELGTMLAWEVRRSHTLSPANPNVELLLAADIHEFMFVKASVGEEPDPVPVASGSKYQSGIT